MTAGNPSLLPNGEQQFIDANGVPLAGGKVYFYVPDTLTPKTTWQDQGETIPNSNPVRLDAAGRAVIWGEGNYRQIVKDALGNLIWDQITSAPVQGGSGSPGGSDKQYQYNNNGVFGGTAAVVDRDGDGTSVVITAADEITFTGNNISGTDINTPNAAANVDSVPITIQPGQAGSGGRIGGGLNLLAGNGDPTDGYGGDVGIGGGNGGSVTGGPGNVFVSGGIANGTLGEVFLTGDNIIVKATTAMAMNVASGYQSLFYLAEYTVSTLPTLISGQRGALAFVTDANSPTWGSTLAGSGSTICLALWNGTNWVAH